MIIFGADNAEPGIGVASEQLWGRVGACVIVDDDLEIIIILSESGVQCFTQKLSAVVGGD